MRQNDVSIEEVQQVFHFSGGKIEVITSEVPGDNNKERAQGAYILTGIASLLEKNEPSFTDDAGREQCKRFGCLDVSNHTRYIEGNAFTGSKKAGWALTAPGLKRGASLIKELAKEDG